MSKSTNLQPTRSLSRRQFLRGTAAAGVGAVAFPHIIPSSVLGADGAVAPSNRITLGIIGTGNQGTNDLRAFLSDERVQVVAVCDVNRESAGYWNGAVAGRDPAKRIVEEHYAKKAPSGSFKGCDIYTDFRQLLARTDLDAVEVATPDHWHAIPMIAAAKAGKHISCQKPLSLTIAEGRAMCDAVQKYQITFQCGSQQRSDSKFRHACELVRNGRLGKLHTVKVGQPAGHPDYGKTGDRKATEPVPEGFDYNLWLGPAPDAPYCPARCHVNFRWNLDYSGGQVTDWGGHHPDIAQWGMGTDHTGPVEIKNAKGNFPARTELWNTATEYSFECIYQNGIKLIVSDKHKMGVTFEGSEGSVYVTRGAFETKPASLWDSQIGPNEIHLYESKHHFRNFIDSLLAKKETIAPCEVAHRSITIAHLGNIAMLLGRDLKWDPAKERFVGDAEANKLLSRPYRAPWKLEG
ncbi:MAG: Gfo/Idh/MocA family oxidoreductase [Verrucomicrobia bacterium]|nr:Gfo/Idh/MocA family oxidoreductase [Verrucomicrobiota bacterium]